MAAVSTACVCAPSSARASSGASILLRRSCCSMEDWRWAGRRGLGDGSEARGELNGELDRIGGGWPFIWVPCTEIEVDIYCVLSLLGSLSSSSSLFMCSPFAFRTSELSFADDELDETSRDAPACLLEDEEKLDE